MAQSKTIYGNCCCHNPVYTYLAEKQFTKEAIAKLSISNKEKKSNASQPASIWYTGGVIRPMIEGSLSKVEAIAFHCGEVLACGSEAEVTARVNQLNCIFKHQILSPKQTLLPGLIEPHVHIVPTALTMGWNDFGPFDGQDLQKPYDMQWLKKKVGKAKEEIKSKGYGDDAWILGRGTDPALMPFEVNEDGEGGLAKVQNLNCSVLDFEKDLPLLIISASLHTAYVNTLAVREIYRALIKKEGDKVKKSYEEFWCEINTHGGLQELTEIGLALDAIPDYQKDKTLENLNMSLHSLFQTASERGVTLMYDAGMTNLMKTCLCKYFGDGANPEIRIGYAQLYEPGEDVPDIKAYQPMSVFENIYQGSVKLVSDGSNQGLTGYQNEPYCCYPANNQGVFNFPPNTTNRSTTPQEYIDLVKYIVSMGWPLMIHANGNRAINFTLEAYKDALAGDSGIKKRHRIEHCSLLSQENLTQMADMGISPSFLIGHVGYWGYVFQEAIFDEQKADQLDLCKSTLDKCMRITLHSDNSVTPLGPLRLMEQAITRKMEGDPAGKVLNPNEKITPEQALKAVTYDAAWQCHADQWVGSLEEGKFADYVILAEDPITMENPEDMCHMRHIPVLETWVGGIKVHPHTCPEKH